MNDERGPSPTHAADDHPAPTPQDNAHRRGVTGARLTLWLIISVLLAVPCLLLLPVAVKPASRAALAVRHGSFQMDNEEGALLFQAMQLRGGESIYRKLDKPPYVAGTYTPLYMAAVASADRLAPPTFKTGRVISWGSAIGVAALLVILVTSLSRNLLAGLLSGLLFFSAYEVYRWIAYFRVDFLALLLTVAGLTVITLAWKRRWTLPAGSLLLVAALYTKQTMIAAPVALLLAGVLVNPHRALHLLGWMLGWGLPPLALLTWLTHGEFIRHTVFYNANTFSAADLTVWLAHTWRLHGWLVVACLGSLTWLLILLPGNTGPARLARPAMPGLWIAVPLYAVLAQWNIVGAAKAGSAENYLLEPLAGMALLAGTALGSISGCVLCRPPDWSRHKTVATSLTGLLIYAAVAGQVGFLTSPRVQQQLFSPYVNPGRADFAGAQQVLSRVRKAANPFTELAIFPLQCGKRPVLQPFIMSELARQGRWNEIDFVNGLTETRYDLIVTQQDVLASGTPIEFTPKMLNAIRANYKLDATIEAPLWTYYILVPRDGADKPDAQLIAQLPRM